MSPSAEIGTVNVKVVATLLSPEEFEAQLIDLIWLHGGLTLSDSQILAGKIYESINVVQVETR